MSNDAASERQDIPFCFSMNDFKRNSKRQVEREESEVGRTQLAAPAVRTSGVSSFIR